MGAFGQDGGREHNSTVRFQNREFKALGHMVEDGGLLWLISSGAELSFRVTGAARLILTLQADDSAEDPARETQRPRFLILADGKPAAEKRMTARREQVTVFDGREKTDAEIRLIKLSEGTQSLMALEGVDTDGKTSPLPARDRRIEFIGDSITCGYGVEGQSEAEAFTTATENACRAYAWRCAEELGADAVLTCFSGHGIISGYTGDPAVQNRSELVPPYYEKKGRNGFVLPSGRRIEEIPRDFSAFQPQDIVIHLGTNDLSWCGTDPERARLFEEGYVRFLKTVRRNNPGAYLHCVLGVMGTGLNASVERAAEAYSRETGDRRIRTLLLEEQNARRDGYGSDFHPSETTQRLLAEKMAEEIRREW